MASMKNVITTVGLLFVSLTANADVVYFCVPDDHSKRVDLNLSPSAEVGTANLSSASQSPVLDFAIANPNFTDIQSPNQIAKSINPAESIARFDQYKMVTTSGGLSMTVYIGSSGQKYLSIFVPNNKVAVLSTNCD